MGFFFKAKKDDIDQGKDSRETAKVISILNQKGGVGKTTMVFHTAHALREQGKKVLCLDLDPQANLSMLLGKETDFEDAPIFQLMINSVRELRPLHSALLPDEAIENGRVDYIPSGQALSGFELTVAGISAPRQLILKKFLEKTHFIYDYDVILIDCPPTLGLLVVNALCASSGVLVPFKPDEFSRQGLKHLDDVLLDIEDMGVTEKPKILGYVPNLVDQRRRQESDDLQNIGSDVEASTATMMDPFFNRATFVKCHAQKKSVFDFKGKDFAPLQESFRKMAELTLEG